MQDSTSRRVLNIYAQTHKNQSTEMTDCISLSWSLSSYQALISQFWGFWAGIANLLLCIRSAARPGMDCASVFVLSSGKLIEQSPLFSSCVW